MERFFRKEYLPAILLYVISAIAFIASLILLYIKSIHWATVLFVAVGIMLWASSLLVKIGNKLREEDERSKTTNEQ